MHVVAPDIEREQLPSTIEANVAYCAVHDLPMQSAKPHGRMSKLTATTLVHGGISRHQRLSRLIVLRIYAAPWVAVQPGSIASEGNEIGERVSVLTSDRLVVTQVPCRRHVPNRAHGSDDSGAPTRVSRNAQTVARASASASKSATISVGALAHARATDRAVPSSRHPLTLALRIVRCPQVDTLSRSRYGSCGALKSTPSHARATDRAVPSSRHPLTVALRFSLLGRGKTLKSSLVRHPRDTGGVPHTARRIVEIAERPIWADGVVEDGIVPARASEVAAEQRGVGEVGAGEIPIAEVALAQEGAGKIGAVRDDAVAEYPLPVGADERGIAQIGPANIAAAQIGKRQVDAAQV